MTTQRMADVVCGLMILGMFLWAALAWPTAPAQFPMHWNLHGEVDRMGGRFEGLFALPLIALGVSLALRFLPRVDPGRANYVSFASTYALVRVMLGALLAGIYGLSQLAARGHAINMGAAVPFIMGALFLGLGNLLGKLRPNWFVGIRTPWTLSSAESWNRTHRIGGWVFVGLGLVTMAGGLFLETRRAIGAMVGLLLLATIGLTLYSYFVWRRDPDKVPPAGRIAA